PAPFSYRSSSSQPDVQDVAGPDRRPRHRRTACARIGDALTTRIGRCGRSGGVPALGFTGLDAVLVVLGSFGRPRQFWSSSFAVVSLPEATASGAVTVLDGLPPPASPVAVLGPPLTARSAPTPSVDVPPGLAGPGGLGGV